MPALVDRDKPALVVQDFIIAIQIAHKGQQHLSSTHKNALEQLATIFKQVSKSPRVENINTPTDSNNITMKSNIKYKHLIHKKSTRRNTPIPNTPDSLIEEYIPKETTSPEKS